MIQIARLSEVQARQRGPVAPGRVLYRATTYSSLSRAIDGGTRIVAQTVARNSCRIA
jgi:hypothetical protein